MLLAVYIAIVAAVFEWCMEDGMVFSFYLRWLERKSFEWRYGWITKPMGLCSFCFTGQIALWFSIFYLRFNAVDVVFFTSIAMFSDKLRVRAW